MDLGVLLLSAVFTLPFLILVIGRSSRYRKTSKIWEHNKTQRRMRAVGPCAVAVGVYKTYEDRKHIEKLYSEDK